MHLARPADQRGRAVDALPQSRALSRSIDVAVLLAAHFLAGELGVVHRALKAPAGYEQPDGAHEPNLAPSD